MTPEQWNNFVAAHPGGSFLQSWQWGQMQEELHVPYWRLAAGEEANSGGVGLVIKRALPWGKSWLYLPRGPLGNDIPPQLISVAEKEGATFIRIEPPAVPPSEGWKKAAHDVQPRHTLVLDLTKSTEELLGEMRQKTRYNIRLADKRGVRVRFSTEAADLDHFIRLSKDVRERSAFHYHPAEYYRAMSAALSPAGMFEIAVAEHEGDVLAVHLLVSFGDTVTYVHGASSSAHRDLMGPHLLQWESIKRAKAAGKKMYDFFGVAPEGAEAQHPWAGITRFKEGFGGTRLTYVGAYDYVLDPVWYWMYSSSRRARSLWR